MTSVTPATPLTPVTPLTSAAAPAGTRARVGRDGPRVGVVLAGVGGGVVAGAAVGSAWGGGLLVLFLALLVVAGLFAAAVRPALGVGAVSLAVGFGNDPLPGAPGGLPGGLQVVHVLVALALGALVLHLLLADRPRLARPDRTTAETFGVVGLFVSTAFLSGFLGRTPYVSTQLNLALLGAALLAVAAVLVTTSVTVLRGLLCVVVAASTAATAPVLGQLQGVSAQRGGTVVDNRPTGSFADPNELGAFAVVALVLALTLLATPRARWWEVVVGAAGGLLALVALVLSFSRGSWVAGGVAVGVLLLAAPLRPRLLSCLAVLGVVGVLLHVSGFAPLPFDVVAQRASTLVEASANPYDVRPYIWQTALRSLADAPVLGSGPGSFPRLAADDAGVLWAYPVVHAHSGALTVAAENGVVGLLGAFGVVALVARGLLRAVRRPGVDPVLAGTATGLLAALVGVGGSLVVDYTLRNPLVLTTVWLVVGLAVAAARLAAAGRRP